MQRLRWVLLTVLLTAGFGANAEEQALTFGMFPCLTPQKLLGGLTPLRDHLQQSTGRPLTIVTAHTF